MNPVDEYLSLLSQAAKCCALAGRTVIDMTDQGDTSAPLGDLIEARVPLLVAGDHERVSGYLPTGLFCDVTGDHRVAAFVVCLELETEVEKLDICRRFQRYERGQPLFAQCPTLWGDVRDGFELISTRQMRLEDGSRAVGLPGGWGRLDWFLAPETVLWASTTFPGKPLFIRLDPWFFAATKPLVPLREAVVRPPRPGWWASLALQPSTRDGAHYVLQASDPAPDTATEYSEYHVRGVRSLEVHAKREAEGRLSIMVEEMVEESRYQRSIGRCLHYDTAAPVGTSAEEAPLDHLDMAINAYFDCASDARRQQKLCDGMVTNASVRTHLLRIEGTPFSSSIEFARQFFRSETLWREWVLAQCASVDLHPREG